MASDKQIAANRRNAQKSTGPRTDAGKTRSRANAVTHGLNIHIETLPDDEKEVFEQRVTAWNATLQPCTSYEVELVRRLAGFSWRLDRADRVQAALIADSISDASEAEIRQKREDFADAALRLLPDLAPEGTPEPDPGPRRLIGEHLHIIDDLNDPQSLVTQLERNLDGCNWMRDRWAELRKTLEAGQAWTDAELTRALRLTGHRPLDAADDYESLRIIVANFALDQTKPDPFSALWNGLNRYEISAYRSRILSRRLRDFKAASPAAAREFLLDTIDKATTRLDELAAEQRALDVALAKIRPSTLLFDDTAEGRWVRLKQQQYNHAIARIVQRFTRARRRGEPMTADPPPRRRPEKPKEPKRLELEPPGPTISHRDLMAAERRKKGVKWRKHTIPPWRTPGVRYLYKSYPGYPPAPKPARRRRKMSQKRFMRSLKACIEMCISLGVLTVLLALMAWPESAPGIADGGGWMKTEGERGTARGSKTGESMKEAPVEVEGDPVRRGGGVPGRVSVRLAPAEVEGDPVRRGLNVGLESLSYLRTVFRGADRDATVGLIGSGALLGGEPVFGGPGCLTRGKTQNEANLGAVLGLAVVVRPASTRPRGRSRGPPRSRIDAIHAARPPPWAFLTVPR